MFESNQTSLQCKIEYFVSKGLGFAKTNFLKENSDYRKYLCEEEVKNTKNGLQAHLAEMNFDRDLRKYFDYRKKQGFIGKIRARLYYTFLQLKQDNLMGNAINEAVDNRGGLMKMIIQHKMIKDNIVNLLLVVNDKD